MEQSHTNHLQKIHQVLDGTEALTRLSAMMFRFQGGGTVFLVFAEVQLTTDAAPENILSVVVAQLYC